MWWKEGCLVLLGGVATFGVQHFLKKNIDNDEKKNLASAFYGEIYSILHLIEIREYVQGLENILRQLERNTLQREINYYAPTIRNNYFNVFQSLLSDVGKLQDPLPRDIVRFYMQLLALLEDFKALEQGERNSWDKGSLLNLFRKDLTMMKNSIDLGNHICLSLAKEYLNIPYTSLTSEVKRSSKTTARLS